MKEHIAPVKRTVNILINTLMLHQLISPYMVCTHARACVYHTMNEKKKRQRVSNFPQQRLHAHIHYWNIPVSLQHCLHAYKNYAILGCGLQIIQELWFILYLIYSLFGSAVGISGYTVLNGRMTKSVGNWKWHGRNQTKYNFRYYPSIFLKELNKTAENLSQVSWSVSWDWSPGPYAWEAVVLTVQLQYSVTLHYHEEIHGTIYCVCDWWFVSYQNRVHQHSNMNFNMNGYNLIFAL
jgi:hypothetical protein